MIWAWIVSIALTAGVVLADIDRDGTPPPPPGGNSATLSVALDDTE